MIDRSAEDARAVRDAVRRVIVELAPIQPGEISPETSVVVDLGYDSLRLVELAVALEDHFGLPAADDLDASDAETVGDVEQRVLKLLERHGPEWSAA